MKVTGEKGIGNILKHILQMFFYGGILIFIFLPFILQLIGIKKATMFVVYPIGLVLLVIAYKFIQLFDSLKKNNPFCDKNVKILKSTGITSAIGSLLWLIFLLYEVILAKATDIVTIVIIVFLFILFLGVSMALYILSELIKEATKYKKENELTI